MALFASFINLFALFIHVYSSTWFGFDVLLFSDVYWYLIFHNSYISLLSNMDFPAPSYRHLPIKFL